MDVDGAFDPEASWIRWFWRVWSLVLVGAVLLLWVRVGQFDSETSELRDELIRNRAFTCRVLNAHDELEPGGPCFDDEVFPLWEQYALERDG